MSERWVRISGYVVGIILLLVFTLTGSLLVGATTPTDGDNINLSYTVSNPSPDGEMTVKVTTELPDNLVDFWFKKRTTAEGFSIKSTDGFTSEDNKIAWDGKTNNPSFTFTAETNQTGHFGTENGSFYDPAKAQWFVNGEHLTMRFRYRYRGDEPTYSESIDFDTSKQGYSGARLGLYGQNVSIIERPSLRLITVGDEQRVHSTSEIINHYRLLRDRFRVNQNTVSLNVFVPPETIRNGGLSPKAEFQGEEDIWVDPGSSMENSNDVWTHEYIHTTQEFETTTETKWIIESSADYYAALYALNTGNTSFQSFYYLVDLTEANSVLSQPSTWTNRAEYKQGRHAVAHIDSEIRKATGGEKSFLDVFSNLNKKEEPITEEIFLNTVEEVSNSDKVRGEADKAINKRTKFTIDEEQDLFTLSLARDTDPDNDSLSTKKEIEIGSNQFNPDTDNDGIDDGDEFNISSDPTSNDSDSDGLLDRIELVQNTSITDSDTDDDSLNDGEEVYDYHTGPKDADTDGDGISDGREIELSTDPTSNDTDGDGLLDRIEFNSSTDIDDFDSDDDGFSDYTEVEELNTNPTEYTTFKSAMTSLLF